MFLEQLLGQESLEKLVEKHGGTRLYVPIGRRSSKSLLSLYSLIGEESTQKLQRFYGGGTFDVPNFKKHCRRSSPLVIRNRNKAIFDFLKLYSCRQAALEFGLTERHIFIILRSFKSRDLDARKQCATQRI
jgi:Mor family transcriptional regulator